MTEMKQTAMTKPDDVVTSMTKRLRSLTERGELVLPKD